MPPPGTPTESPTGTPAATTLPPGSSKRKRKSKFDHYAKKKSSLSTPHESFYGV